jgi:shikimate dehydrogenase
LTIDTSTQLFGVLGFPVKHSRSPVIFNRAFAECGKNAVYLAFEQQETGKAIEAMRALSIKGLSVTLPHKVEAMKFVDDIDESARRVDCLNTIVNHNGKLIGYNFDGEGALVPLRTTFPDFATKRFAFLGAGGSAQGIVVAMAALDHVKVIDFFVRDVSKVASLTQKLSALGVISRVFDLTDSGLNHLGESDFVINTTPIGMAPKIDASPVESHFLRAGQVVYDIVYNPLETKLLQNAKSQNLPTITGVEMFLGQASLQYQLWFQEKAPIEVMRSAFEDSFKN